MDKPLVSVVMPAYGGTDTIVCAIDSALRQDVHLEVIVVNDCSPNEQILQSSECTLCA